MALYPTVMVVNQLLGRFVPLPLALSVLLTNAHAMALVRMVFLPQLSRVLRGWLLPAQQLRLSKTVGGAVVLLAVIGACLALFLVLFPG
jgi:antibiotic biosynthesis monooxygenase (ABM) superfamily enzyme